MDNYQIIKHPLATEKSIRLMEAENKLVFVVDKRANKQQIKKAVEEIFKTKVIKVNTHHSISGQKRAYVTLSKETPAIDVATSMGIM